MQRTSLFILLIGLSAVLSFHESPQAKVGNVKSDEKMAKFIPLSGITKIKSVMHATTQYFNANQVHDHAVLLRFIDRNSQFLFNSLLPDNGYYTGKRGFLQIMDTWKRTAHLKDATYRINFVDEARQISVVTYSCSGTFLHNNAVFDNIAARIFIKWDLGKISKMNLIELTPQKTYSLFLTPAHKQFNKLIEASYLGGNNTRNVIDCCVSKDVTISFNNIYPLSLIMANSSKCEGKDMVAILKGKDNLIKLTHLGNKFFFNLTSKIKILFSNADTVVAATILKPTANLFLPIDSKTYWKFVTVLYSINSFDDKGMLKEVQLFVNRPFLPHQLRYANNMLAECCGESLSSLLAPIRAAITIDAAKI